MCVKVRTGDSIRIAEKDIVVYKNVYKKRKFWNPIFFNIHQSFNYNKIINALNFLDLPIEHLKYVPNPIIEEDYLKIIRWGFHCATIRNSRWHVTPNVICIVPKGAEYCYGQREDIVSNKLIVFKHRWNYWWYKFQQWFLK